MPGRCSTGSKLPATPTAATPPGYLSPIDYEATTATAVVDTAREEICAGWHFYAWGVVTQLAWTLARAERLDASGVLAAATSGE